MMHNMLRPFDLTINRRGLFLRIPGIRDGAKKVFVTNEPSRALRLLWYDPMAESWQMEFGDLEELFQHTSRCRLFRGYYGTELTGEDGSIMAGEAPIRKKARPMTNVLTRSPPVRETFRTWVADFIPTCVGDYPGTTLTKSELCDEILAQFPETRAAYDLAFLKVKRREQKDLYTRVIKPSIPSGQDIDPQWRCITAAALRDMIMGSDYSLGLAPTRSLKSSSGIYDEEEVRIFVEEAWRLVGDEAWGRLCGPDSEHSQRLMRRLVEEADFELLEGAEETHGSDDEDDKIRFPPKPEGFRQTWYETDMNDI